MNGWHLQHEKKSKKQRERNALGQSAVEERKVGVGLSSVVHRKNVIAVDDLHVPTDAREAQGQRFVDVIQGFELAVHDLADAPHSHFIDH